MPKPGTASVSSSRTFPPTSNAPCSAPPPSGCMDSNGSARPRESGEPDCKIRSKHPWIPACAGMSGRNRAPPLPLRDEDRLRNHPMDALGAVHHLGHVIIDRDARDHVGLLAREVRKALGNEIDRLAHRDF